MITLATLILTGAGCNDDVPDPQVPPDSGDAVRLIGRWKLIKLTVNGYSRPYEEIDYSEKDIIYEFQKNGILVITGETDDIFVFNDFKEGEHTYAYRETTPNPLAGMARNLAIDKSSLEFESDWRYIAYLPDETMVISRNTIMSGEIDDDHYLYLWGKHFIKLK